MLSSQVCPFPGHSSVNLLWVTGITAACIPFPSPQNPCIDGIFCHTINSCWDFRTLIMISSAFS